MPRCLPVTSEIKRAEWHAHRNDCTKLHRGIAAETDDAAGLEERVDRALHQFDL